MRKLWLLFAQAVTLTLAALFVVSLVKPDWLAWRAQVVEVRESVPAVAVLAPATSARLSFSDAAKRATPAVVNISATREVKRPTTGMITSFTSESTILPNAPPMITPTARSTTLPFTANSRNSDIMPMGRFSSLSGGVKSAKMLNLPRSAPLLS